MRLYEQKPEVKTAVEELWKYSYLTPSNYTIIRNYVSNLESEAKLLKWILEDEEDCNIENITYKLNEIEDELEFFKFNVQTHDTRITINKMHDLVIMRIIGMLDSGYHTNPFYDFKKLVEMINCYYHIENPYKPSNKIAYGWKFSIDKGNRNDFYKGTRLYLFGCIKNYLIKNNKEWDSLEIRKICGLANITEEDC